MISLNKFGFWGNYVSVVLNAYCIVTLNSWFNFLPFFLSLLYVILFEKYLDVPQRSFANSLNGSIIVSIALTMACNEASPFQKFLELIVVVIGFFAALRCIIIMVECTLWYDNMKWNKEYLLAQERIGDEPDPKDFENSP